STTRWWRCARSARDSVRSRRRWRSDGDGRPAANVGWSRLRRAPQLLWRQGTPVLGSNRESEYGPDHGTGSAEDQGMPDGGAKQAKGLVAALVAGGGGCGAQARADPEPPGRASHTVGEFPPTDLESPDLQRGHAHDRVADLVAKRNRVPRSRDERPGPA